MAAPRKAKVNITYTKKSKAKTAGNRPASVMAEYTEGFTYTDPATGESDTISITLSNADLRWLNKWMPRKTDKLTAKIVQENWDKDGQKKSFSCGKFCLDDMAFSGPELTCTIGGVSVPEGNAFRSTGRDKEWKEITLKELAAEIAGKYHLSFDYSGGTIRLGELEQSNESDCSFLNKICQDYAMAIKVYSGKIIIYDKGEYEAKKPVATICKSDMQSWSYNSTLTGTYTGATMKYSVDSDEEDDKDKKKEKKELACTVGTGKRILAINEKADSLADAQLKTCGRVNTENEKAVTMSITIMANTKITAGCTIKITGLYKLSGKYFVDRVTHKIEEGSGYTMELELHKCQKRITLGTASGGTFAVGDRVIVNGPAYYAGNGGNSNQCTGMPMYITEILGSGYIYQYGVAMRQGGARYGWCAESSLTKE